MLNQDLDVRVNIISDYRYSVLLCCINVRHHVLITLRFTLLSSVTAMLSTFTCCLAFCTTFRSSVNCVFDELILLFLSF
jgi:hypothetical protein